MGICMYPEKLVSEYQPNTVHNSNLLLSEKQTPLYLSSKVYRMIDQVHSRRGIHGWNPHQASPADIKSSCQTKSQVNPNEIKYEQNKLWCEWIQKIRKPRSCAISIVFQYPASHQKNLVTYTSINVVLTSIESATLPFSSYWQNKKEEQVLEWQPTII